MKLVEILARELEKWPLGNTHAWQDQGGEVRFSHTISSDFQATKMCEDHVRVTNQGNPTSGVTQEMWQAERERIAKPGKKANAEGWIRHRGGKCPVQAGVLVDVKLRCKHEEAGIDAMEAQWISYGIHPNDVMQYRIHKPAGQPAPESEPGKIDFVAIARESHSKNNTGSDSIEMDIEFPSGVIRAESVSSSCGPITLDWQEVQPITAATKRAHPVDDCEPDPSQQSAPIVINMRDPHPENPLIWRDRIREIDRTVEALEEERVSLIQRLEGEGLQLLRGKVCGAVQAAEDMSDWRNWKPGDMVVVSSENDSSLQVGTAHAVRSVEEPDYDGLMPVSVWLDGKDWSWPEALDESIQCCFKFHSRPSA